MPIETSEYDTPLLLDIITGHFTYSRDTAQVASFRGSIVAYNSHPTSSQDILLSHTDLCNPESLLFQSSIML